MPRPARPAAPRTGGARAPSYLDVVAVLEDPGAAEALDPIGEVQPQVLAPEMARAHTGARVVPLGDPGARRPRVLTPEAAQQRSPIEPALRLARRDPVGRLGEDAARRRELPPQRVGRAGPPVVEHPRTGRPRPHAPLLRAHAEPLRVLVGADVLAQAHAPHLAPVPVAVGRERVEVAVEMEIIDQQAFHPRVPVPLADPLLQDLRAPLVADLVGPDGESPGAAAGR